MTDSPSLTSDSTPAASGVAGSSPVMDVLTRLAGLAAARNPQGEQAPLWVGETAAVLAHLAGGSDEFVRLIGQAACLHDLGRLGVADHLSLKPQPLTPDERLEVQRHTLIGAQVLGGTSDPMLQLASQITLTHHERWDGRGYPHGLSGAAIPLAGRIVHLLDVFDALVSPRPYRQAWSLPDAVEYVRSQGGWQFDPQLAALFADLYARGELPPHPSGKTEPVLIELPAIYST